MGPHAAAKSNIRVLVRMLPWLTYYWNERVRSGDNVFSVTAVCTNTKAVESGSPRETMGATVKHENRVEYANLDRVRVDFLS